MNLDEDGDTLGAGASSRALLLPLLAVDLLFRAGLVFLAGAFFESLREVSRPKMK